MALNGGLPRLNEVRPRRPEQSDHGPTAPEAAEPVSMKSGLEGRNNGVIRLIEGEEQVKVSMKSGLEGRNNLHPLPDSAATSFRKVSMKSGLEGRNNMNIKGRP